jgi:hypothetical protein
MSRQPSDRSSLLRARLGQVRRRLLWIGGSAGIAWGLAGAVVLVVVAAWLDLIWEMPAEVRIGMLACAGAAGLLVAATLLTRAIRGGRDTSIARRLDLAGRCGGRVLTGVELDTGKPGVAASLAPDLTHGLARIAVSHAAEAAVRVPSSRAVPATPLGRSFGLLGVELTTVALLAACLPGLIQTQWERFLHPYTDVPPYSPIRILVEPGDTQVVYGDSLDLHARAEGGPVDRLELVLGGSAGQPAETLPMFPEPDGRWRAALARVTEPAAYFVRAYRARSPQYHIGLITVPRIEEVRFRVEPPSYTRLAPYQGPMPKGGLSGLPGTKVQIWAKSNRPLSGGVLTVTAPAGPVQQPMQPSQPGASEATVQFVITADAKFRVDLRDVDGQESREPFLGTVTLLADQRPFLRILKPPAMSLATPNTVLPVILSAADD